MKKIISLFLLIPILLCGCELQNISQVLFIASIGVEKEEDTYIGYFYLPLSSDVGKTENKENQGIGQYAKVEGKTLAEVFENIQFSTELEVNLRHASSMVIHKDLMNDDFLNELIAFVKRMPVLIITFIYLSPKIRWKIFSSLRIRIRKASSILFWYRLWIAHPFIWRPIRFISLSLPESFIPTVVFLFLF